MQHLPVLTVLRRDLREAVCSQCMHRPAASESLPPDRPRSCESLCAIFNHLPQLRLISKSIEADRLEPYDHAVRDQVCQSCVLSATHGDYCLRRTQGTCPLMLYSAEVFNAVDRVRRAYRGVAHRLAQRRRIRRA